MNCKTCLKRRLTLADLVWLFIEQQQTGQVCAVTMLSAVPSATVDRHGAFLFNRDISV